MATTVPRVTIHLFCISLIKIRFRAALLIPIIKYPPLNNITGTSLRGVGRIGMTLQ